MLREGIFTLFICISFFLVNILPEASQSLALQHLYGQNSVFVDINVIVYVCKLWAVMQEKQVWIGFAQKKKKFKSF